MKKFLILAFFIFLPFAATAEEAQAPQPQKPAAAADAPLPPPPPSARKWNMDAEDSSIIFRGKQMGKEFEGKLPKFEAQINFDPGKLAESKVVAEMDMLFIDAGDDERNKNLLGKDWLDAMEFKTARFETFGFKKTGDNAYIADATLTIHGVIQEIEFPFTLEFSKDSGKDKAVMNGKVTLDRSKFQLGLGDWADPSVIANEIPVEVKVTAYAAE